MNVEAANERFNHFHDGDLRRIAFTQASELMELRASAEPGAESWEEEVWDGVDMELDIHHSNYDYPNQPENRVVRICASKCTELSPNIEQFLGNFIFSLRFEYCTRGIACVLTHHPEHFRVRSGDNGTQTTLFIAESIELEELLYEGKRRSLDR